MSGVIQIVRISPVSTVNENDCGMRAGTRGKPQVAELQRVGAVGNPCVGFGRRQGQDVLAHGSSGGSGGQESSSRHDGKTIVLRKEYEEHREPKGTLVFPPFMSENRWCIRHLCSILETWTQMFVTALHKRAMHGLTDSFLSPCVQRGFFAVRFV